MPLFPRVIYFPVILAACKKAPADGRRYQVGRPENKHCFKSLIAASSGSLSEAIFAAAFSEGRRDAKQPARLMAPDKNLIRKSVTK